MLGAILGDVIGSIYERDPIKTADFPLFGPGCRFTDDTVMTLAVADCLLSGGDYTDYYHQYFAMYPNAGFGGMFYQWARSESREPYFSLGNGAAMRVSPVAFAFDTLEDVLEEARRTALPTHNHPEGIRGAQAVAAAVFLARQRTPKHDIRRQIESAFDYALDVPLDRLRPGYRFDVTCQGTVPPALRAFLEGESYEEAVRLAVSLGGDSDTLACIAGAVAGAYYGVPDVILEQGLALLDDRCREVTLSFTESYPVSRPLIR